MIIVAALHTDLVPSALEARDRWSDQEANVVGELGTRIRVERDGRVLRIVLVRPERGNAIDPKLIDKLWTAVSELEGSVGCIAIVAEGKTFCVGGDVRVLPAETFFHGCKDSCREGVGA